MKAVAVILAFIGAGLLGYVLTIAAYVGYIELSGTLDREGALAMAAAFFFGPVMALVCGIAAAVWAGRRMRSRTSPSG